MFSGFLQCFQAFFSVFRISKTFINLSAAGRSSGHFIFLFLLFSMPIMLVLCRLFSFIGILFPHFLFLACRSHLLYAGFSLSPASFFLIFSFWHADHACSMPAFLLHRHPFSSFFLFGMPIMLALCRLFSFIGILFSHFFFLACRSRLLYADFSPSPASFFLIFSFWHADHSYSMPTFLLHRHPFSSFSLFSMPIMLVLCQPFSFIGILFPHFFFFACLSHLLYAGYAWLKQAFHKAQHVFSSFPIFTAFLQYIIITENYYTKSYWHPRTMVVDCKANKDNDTALKRKSIRK